MKLRITLKTKIAVGIIVATTILGVAVSITAYRLIQKEIADFSTKYIDAVIMQQEDVVTSVFTDAMSFTQRIAEHRLVIDYLQEKDPQLQDQKLFDYFNASNIGGKYESINIMDVTGKDLVSTNPAAVDQNFAFRDYFKKAIAGNPAVEDAISQVTQTFGYYFSHPIKNDSGEVVGIIAVKLKRDILEKTISPKVLSEDGAAMLVDEFGIVIQASRPELLYKSIGALKPEAQQSIVETHKFNGITIEPLPYEHVDISLESLQGKRSFQSYDNLHKQDEVISIAKIAAVPYFIMIEESTQSFADMARNIAWLIILSTMIPGCVGSVLLWLFIRRLLKPLDALKAAAIQISKGNLDQTVPVLTGDELGALGDAFNLMTKNLKDFYANLEGKIWERTADFEKYKLAVEGSSDTITITDIDGRILYVNKAGEAMTGYSTKEIVGNRPTLWGKQMPKVFYEQMWHTIKEEKKPFHGELVNRRKTGEKYTVELTIAPLFMNKRTLYGFVGIERDITSHAEVDRAKTEFVSIASHQLRTPLAVINWYIEMLTSEEVGKINENQRKYLDQVYLASKRMVDLVNSLLSVSRIDLKTYNVEPEMLDFSTVADSVLVELGKTIEKKNLTITKEYDPEMPLVNADPSLLRVIFQNLISNAVKYTPTDGSIQITIKRDGDAGKDGLISVADTGYGIPIEQQKQIFQKFFRADNAREKEPDGNGLGLYIVKSIVEHEDGTIWFTSTEGKGSTFYVKFPLAGMKKNSEAKPLGL